MNEIQNKKNICTCGNTNHRPGARYCTNCGGLIPPQEKEVPVNITSRIIAKKTCPLRPTEKIVGTNLISLPFFVTSSGYYWHYRFDFHAQKNQLPQLNLPAIDQGEIIGIIANESMDPWALICWNYLIILFNAFTTERVVVWQKAKGKNQICFRLPTVMTFDTQGKSGPLFRVFMIIKTMVKTSERYITHVSDFCLQVGQHQDRWDFRVNPVSNWPKLEAQRVLMVSAPIMNQKRSFVAVYLSNVHKEKGRQFLVLSFNDRLKGYDKKNVIRYGIRGMPNKRFKMIPQKAYFQCQFQSDVFVWLQVQDESGNHFFEIYELRELTQKNQPAYVMISWGTFEWYLGATSPLAVIQNETDEKFLAFLDNDDMIQIINDTGKALQFPFSPSPLDRLTPFIICNNTIWAVEKEYRHVKKFWISELLAHDTAIDLETTDDDIGNICSELVLSCGNIYYLRKDINDNNQHSKIRLECIQ